MTQFSFPFKGTNNAELLDEQLFHALLRNQPSGNWLVSRDGWWHGGVHFTSSSGSEVDMAAGVRCIADGEVVAYRLNKAPLSTTVTDQTGSKAAPYSTGFVLLRHQLAAPKPKTPPTPASQRTSASPAPARPAEPPPKPLVFFSLYMHLQSLEEYQTNDARHPSAKQPRPAFWQRVYAVSDSANNRPRQQPGRTPCGASVYKTATPGSRLGILPVGTELLVRGSPRHHLVRIAEILGEAAALPDTWGHAPDPLIAQGWIDQRLLTLVDTPNARSLLDEVVILSEPYPIKAGELVGHLGLYHWHSQPDSVNRMLHLEVFCGDELPGFIQTSRTVAARLPRDSCTILKTGLGAVLWERHTSTVADTQIPANTRLTAPTNDKHTDTAWIQVSAAGQSYWISRQDWGGIQQHGNKTSSNVAAWRSYPDSFKAPVNPLTLTTGVDHYRALSWLEQHKAELGARDQDGNRWWKVHSALRTTTGFTDIEGWVKAVQHPGGNVSSEHPGDWVDFQLEASDEGGTGTLFADRQQFKDYLGNPRGGMGSKDKLAPLFQKLHGFMTRGGDGSSAANDLRQAASSRWIAERLARAIARHDSEWSSNSLAKWKELKRVLQTPENAGQWEQELVRIEKLAWWEQVSGKIEDFPASSKVCHLHPVAMVGNHIKNSGLYIFHVSIGEYIISKESIELIFSFEGYEKYPYVPSNSSESGVSIGYGYDLGHQTSTQIKKDLSEFYPQQEVDKFLLTQGLKGENARAALTNVKEIPISKENAINLAMRTKERFAQMTVDVYPETIKLHPHCQGALLSLIYNRGNLINSSDKRKEMKEIQEHLQSGNYSRIPEAIRSMKRLWEGSGQGGLVKRRESEAILFEKGLNLS